MTNPKTITLKQNEFYRIEPSSEPPDSFDTERAKNIRMAVIASAFSIPHELLRPHMGAIEAAQQGERLWREGRLRSTAAAIDDLMMAMVDTSRTMERFAVANEMIRLWLIGRRCRVVLGVVIVLVYLVVRMLV